MLIFTSVSINAQSYKAFQSAYKTNSGYGWSNWSDWKTINVTIYMDTANDMISIYTDTAQIFKINSTYNNGNAYTDASGGSNIKFSAVRLSDYHRCDIRLRIETNGNSQIYVDYRDCMIVFNVIRK